MYPQRLKMLPEPTEEVAEQIWLMFDCDKEKREDAYHTLKDWLETQPHLPKNVEKSKCLCTYLWSKTSIQRSKVALDMYYTLRTALPEMYANRDPTSEWFQKTSAAIGYIPMPRLTEKYERPCLLRGMVPDLSELDMEEAIKLVFMIADIRMKYDVAAGDIYIIDLNGMTPAVIAKFTPALMKKVAVVTLKAFNAKVKGIHLINAPPYVDALVTLLRTVFNKKKIRERIHAHPKGTDTIFNFVDKKYLPEEYGGEQGTCQELWDGWKDTLVEFRDWFLEQEDVKADESKRPIKPLTSNDLFGFEGSFRQLSVD